MGRFAHDLLLCPLKRYGFRYIWVLELAIEFRHEIGGGLIVNEPETGQGAACAGFHRNPGQTKSGPIVSHGGFAGAERKQFEWILTGLKQTDKLRQTVHCDLVVVCEKE